VLADVNSTYTAIVTSVFSSTIAAKTWLATIAMLLVVVQVLTAARIYGRLRTVIPLPPRVVARVHRYSGRVALLFTLPVVFHCVFILGFQTASTRVLIHSIVGSFVYGVFAVKIIFVRSRAYPAWVLPVAGGTLFAMLATLWFSSAFWYLTQVRFGF
jgi:Family of unknown function (DUF6529)